MARNYKDVVSFRPDWDQAANLRALRGTFPERSWSEAMRWLLDQPEVKHLIEERCMDVMLEEGS